MVAEQGLLGLVEEEDGIVLLVKEAEGFVRVVCPKTPLEINESAAVATKMVRMFICSPKRISVARFSRHQDPIPTIRPVLSV